MDRRIISLLVAIIAFYTFATPVLAISFTATMAPSEANASDQNVLVNFSISHSNTTANVSQLNITLPATFTYSGGIGENATTSDNTTILSRQTNGAVIWLNTTPAGFVSGANRFFFEIDTPGSNATFNFNVSVKDTAGIITSSNVTFKLLDTIAPQFSSNTTSPSTGPKYIRNRTYEFSATWTDRISVQAVLIEHNFTGTSTNYTMSKTGSSSYIYNTTDIAAAAFVWRMYANDTNNNVNATDRYAYNITKADNPLEIFFDGSRNQDYQTSNESSFNATANSSTGTVFIYRSNNLVTSGSTPQSSIASLTSGAYTFKANATGNQNYTDNSTGITYTATLTGPAPKWSSNTTSLPSTYSNTTTSTFEVTWNDKSDANGFSVAIIEINHTGSSVNYTMSRVSGTNRSQFSATIPGGIIRWKVYANNSNNVFNTTSLFSSQLTKATPALTLSSSLGWEVDVGGVSNVTCAADTGQVTPKLYREGAAVSIPDATSLSVGKYVYKCNTTETQNFSSKSESKTLEVKSFTKYLSIVNFTSALKQIEIFENSSVVINIEVKNTGNLSDTITLAIEDINENWFTINVSSLNIPARGGIGAFSVNFSVGFVEIRDYSGRFRLAGKEETLYSNFTLRVLPSGQTKIKLNESLFAYKEELLKLEKELNDAKAQNKNITAAEEEYNKLKAKIEIAERNIARGNYANMAQILDEIKSLIDSSRESISKSQTVESLPEILKKTVEENPYATIIIAVAIIVVVILAYLFWPAKEVPESPTFKRPIKKSSEPSVLDKIKDKLKSVTKKSNKAQYKYREK